LAIEVGLIRGDTAMVSNYQPDNFTSIAYFPDGKRMFSGSLDKIARRWDLQSGKEIKEARDVCKEAIWVVAVSRDGRWVVTGGRAYELGLKAGDHLH